MHAKCVLGSGSGWRRSEHGVVYVVEDSRITDAAKEERETWAC